MISPQDELPIAPGTEAPAVVARHQTLLRASQVVYDEENQSSDYSRSLAVDLNRILERVEYTLDTCSHDSDLDFAESALRIVDLVASDHSLKTSSQPGGHPA